MRTTICPRCNGTGHIADDRAIGQEMRQLREAKQISLREIARRMHYSAAYLSDLELGSRHWNTKVTNQFKAALEES